MKPLKFPQLLVLLVVASAITAAITWQLARHAASSHGTAATGANGKKIKFYQSAMHPWIVSDKPGKCTVCGMELVPVYEGEKGFGGEAGSVSLDTNSINVIGVQSAPVARRPLHRTLRVAGTVVENDTRHRVLSAYVEGRIDKLFVNYLGAEVQAGQPLATFYSPTLLNAERDYVLLAGNGSAPHTPEQHRLMETAAQRLRRYGLTPEQITALPEKPATDIHSEIIAPETGTIVKRDIYEGQYVKEGDPLFELADFSTMWFVFDAYEHDLAWLTLGQMVEVTVPSAPGRTFPAKIAFIDPTIADMTRSAKVRVEIANPLVEQNGRSRRELLHQVYAEAVVHLETPPVLAIPRRAALSPNERPVVYLDHGGGNYEQRAIKLGRAGDDYQEVLDGLSEGDPVVTSGNLLIDAQAQLNQGVASAVHQHDGDSNTAPAAGSAPIHTTHTPLSGPQQTAVAGVLSAIDGVAAALAADNVAQYNERLAAVQTAVNALPDAFANAADWEPLIRPIAAAGNLHQAPDLPAARKGFHGLSDAVVALAKAARQTPGDWNKLKIFQCPMVKNAFPGAPRTGAWIQLSGTIRNPYFGAEMIDCGTEVKP